MKFKQLCCLGFGLLAGIETLSAGPILVNGGKDLKYLAKIENELNDGSAEINLSVGMRHGRWPIGYLEMAQAGKFTNPALCAAWHSNRHQPATGEYKVSAEITLVGEEEVSDGVSGVIGWLDSESGVGISFVLNHYDGFQVGTVSFLAEDAEANRSLDGLFDLDGLPARATTNSAWSGKGSHDHSKWVRMELTFSPPTDEDRAVLEDVTARITAVVFKTAKKIVEGTREIVLLTNLPMPERSKHRFGYFGYWDSLWDEGGKIAICRNLKIDGEIYNSPPTIESIGDHVINENETAEVRVVVDDVEVYSSKLEVTADSSNPALVPSEGIEIDSSGSKRNVIITPASGAFGEAVITFTVSDGEKQAATAFTLTVNESSEPSVLTVARGGEGKVALEWAGGGELQASDNLKNWQPVEDAASPFAVDPIDGQKFFRVLQP